MVDTALKYTTRSGASVTIYKIVPRNNAGHVVTFPLKGYVRELVNVRHRHRSQIWQSDGRACVFGDHDDDLMELVDA